MPYAVDSPSSVQLLIPADSDQIITINAFPIISLFKITEALKK